MALSIPLPAALRIPLCFSESKWSQGGYTAWFLASHASCSRFSRFRLRNPFSRAFPISSCSCSCSSPFLSPHSLRWSQNPGSSCSFSNRGLQNSKIFCLSSMAPGMEIEIKLRLSSKESYTRVFDLLKERLEATYDQENIFFDGSEKELSSNRVVLRLRFYNGDEKCIITVKGNTVMVDGISRTTEEEEALDVKIGREALKNPQFLHSSNSTLISSLIEKYGVKNFVCLGGFENVRHVFAWKEHKIELDETKFAFGTQYEIECETTEPELLKKELELFLGDNGVAYQYSQKSKFGIFKSGKLPVWEEKKE